MPIRKTPKDSYLACAAPLETYGKTFVGVFVFTLATCPLACSQEGRVMVHVQRPGASLLGEINQEAAMGQECLARMAKG